MSARTILKHVYENGGMTEYQYERIDRLLKERERPHGEWKKVGDRVEAYDISGIKTWGQKYECSNCGFLKTYIEDFGFYSICPNCGADMSANDRQVTGKLDSEYKAKVKELEDAIAKCEQAEKEFKRRTCKFRSQINCDFCAFHSECEEHWKEGEKE